ncbi:unnamed protein product [Moneuplotes crassus]|uniref:Uncharacterized protein n=1 Tax=Euplotes crassus TaxID=5936 RepID=A0AAD1Y359_EUPCR|nr:unnamed protein product [Moneuplotes crassus]
MKSEEDSASTSAEDITQDKVKENSNKKKYILTKQSLVSNVLPYFGKMQECDIFMKNFSTETRCLWNKNLKLWIKHLEDNLEELKVSHENIDFWTKNPPIHNCRLYFNDYHIYTKKWTAKIIKFVKKVPCMSQIKRIKIERSGRCQFENREGPAIEKIFNNLDQISKVLGHEPSRRSDPSEPPKKHSVYFSDIISAKKYYGIINFKLMIFPKVIQESKILCVDSCYILDNHCIYVCKIDEEDFPFICHLKFGDPRIPIFENVKKIKLCKDGYKKSISRIKINKIIRKYYPNLKKVKLDGDFEIMWKSSPKLCDIIKSTNIKIVGRQRKLKCKTPILLKAENAIVAKNLCKNDGKVYYRWYRCNIEVIATDFIIRDENIYIFMFYIICISNCSKTNQSPSHLENIKYFQNTGEISHPFKAYDWLILSTTSLTSVSPTYTSFSDCSIKFFPDPSSRLTLLPSNLSFYDSLPSSVPIHITCSPANPAFCLYTLFFNVYRLLDQLAPSAHRYCIDVIECPGHRSFKDVFTVEAVQKFKAFRVVVLVKTGLEEGEIEEMVQKVNRWVQLKKCRGIVVRGIWGDRYEEECQMLRYGAERGPWRGYASKCVVMRERRGARVIREIVRRIKVPMGWKVEVE